jgi:hypothetical protein
LQETLRKRRDKISVVNKTGGRSATKKNDRLSATNKDEWLEKIRLEGKAAIDMVWLWWQKFSFF